jgi:pSer/pThr/pTyr-binding forkhead associated (FHA) protein
MQKPAGFIATMKLKLILISGKNAGREIPISRSRVLIGQAEGCHIRLQDNRVSNWHCVLSVDGGLPFIEDCRSTTGTFVNGKRIVNQQPLKDGDRLAIGRLVVEVRLTETADGQEQQQTDAPTVAVVAGTTGNHGGHDTTVVDSTRYNGDVDIPGKSDKAIVGQNGNVAGPDPNAGALGRIAPVRNFDETPDLVHQIAREDLDRRYKRWGIFDVLLLALIGILSCWIGCAVAFLLVASVLLFDAYSASQQRKSNAGGQRRLRLELSTIDLVLAGTGIVLIGVGELLLHWSATGWGWYVTVLDASKWSPRTWIGVAAAWDVVLLAIRFWPQADRSSSAV